MDEQYMSYFLFVTSARHEVWVSTLRSMYFVLLCCEELYPEYKLCWLPFVQATKPFAVVGGTRDATVQPGGFRGECAKQLQVRKRELLFPQPGGYEDFGYTLDNDAQEEGFNWLQTCYTCPGIFKSDDGANKIPIPLFYMKWSFEKSHISDTVPYEAQSPAQILLAATNQSRNNGQGLGVKATIYPRNLPSFELPMSRWAFTSQFDIARFVNFSNSADPTLDGLVGDPNDVSAYGAAWGLAPNTAITDGANNEGPPPIYWGIGTFGNESTANSDALDSQCNSIFMGTQKKNIDVITAGRVRTGTQCQTSEHCKQANPCYAGTCRTTCVFYTYNDQDDPVSDGSC